MAWFNKYIKITLTLTITTIIFIITQMINQNVQIDLSYLRMFTLLNKKLNLSPSNNFSCCYRENNQTIIFFHLSNKTDQWLPLELCAFRSAAIMNNNTGICILTKCPMKPHPTLNGLTNIQFSQLDINLLFNNTPLANWYKNYVLNRTLASNVTSYAMYELSDALRFAYLYKYGGIYMDTDILTLRNLGDLKNVLAWQDSTTINGAVMAFEKKHPFVKAALDGFMTNFVANFWGTVGPYFITKLHQKELVDNSTYKVLPWWAFYPTHYKEAAWSFDSNRKEQIKLMINNSYVLHLWRVRTDVSQHWLPNAVIPNGSFVKEFMENICPIRND